MSCFLILTESKLKEFTVRKCSNRKKMTYSSIEFDSQNRILHLEVPEQPNESPKDLLHLKFSCKIWNKYTRRKSLHYQAIFLYYRILTPFTCSPQIQFSLNNLASKFCILLSRASHTSSSPSGPLSYSSGCSQFLGLFHFFAIANNYMPSIVFATIIFLLFLPNLPYLINTFSRWWHWSVHVSGPYPFPVVVFSWKPCVPPRWWCHLIDFLPIQQNQVKEIVINIGSKYVGR